MHNLFLLFYLVSAIMHLYSNESSPHTTIAFKNLPFQLRRQFWNLFGKDTFKTMTLQTENTKKDYPSNNPMDTSSSIRYRFDVEISRGTFVEITSILKGESTWKLWHRFDVDISMWIRLSKSTKYRWVLHVDFSMSFRRPIDVTSVLAVSILSFSNIFCSGNLF